MARIGRLLPGARVTTGNPDTVNDAFQTATNVGNVYDLRGQLGAVLRSADGLTERIYVQFSATSTGKTPAVGQLCYWMSSTSTTLDPTWVVDNNTTANSCSVTQPAGVLRNACTRGNGVWLVTKHPYIAINATSTLVAAVGDIVVTSTGAAGDPSVVTSTSTVIGAAGVGATPMYFLGGGAQKIGYMVSTSTAMPSFVSTTSTGATGVALPVTLNIA